MDIVLFNLSDLRVRDHEPLYYANLTNNEIIHIFIWDCKWDDKLLMKFILWVILKKNS